MNRNLLTAAALVAIPLIWASAANADIITTGAGSGSVTFTSNGNGTLNFSTAGFPLLQPAGFQSPTGTLLLTGTSSFSAMSGTTGAEVGGIFPVVSGGTEIFSFNGGTGGSLTGTVTWPGIKDGTSTPQFDTNALLTITSVSGTNAAFLADFPVGSKATIDFTVNLSGTTLTALAGTASGTTATATYSSGEVLPTPPSVPEPASLTLLGSALIGLGWLGRRQRKTS